MPANPNKVNQYTEPDPRQSLFLSYYLDPKSETFSDVTNSGIKAGFTEVYARNLTAQLPKWFNDSLEELRDKRLVQKAERNLDLFLEGEDEKIKADITKFVLSRLKKEKYSERTELTGKNGKDLPVPILTIEKDVRSDNSNKENTETPQEN